MTENKGRPRLFRTHPRRHPPPFSCRARSSARTASSGKVKRRASAHPASIHLCSKGNQKTRPDSQCKHTCRTETRFGETGYRPTELHSDGRDLESECRCRIAVIYRRPDLILPIGNQHAGRQTGIEAHDTAPVPHELHLRQDAVKVIVYVASPPPYCSCFPNRRTCRRPSAKG